MARIRQPRPDSGLGFQVKVLNTFPVVSSSLSGRGFQVKVLETFQVVSSLLGSETSREEHNGTWNAGGP
jgi:hypothetical protein